MSRVAQKEDLSDPDVISALRRAWSARAPADRAVPADGGRHPRHQPARSGTPGRASCWRTCTAPTLRALGGAQPNLQAEIEARKQEARQRLALQSAPARHRGAAVEDAGHALLRAPRRQRHRLACARAVAPRATPGSRWCARARRRSAKACRCWSTRPTATTCSRASAATSTAPAFSILDAKVHTTRAGYALDTFQVVSTHMRATTAPAAYRDLISLVETQLAHGAAGRRPAARAAAAAACRAACARSRSRRASR